LSKTVEEKVVNNTTLETKIVEKSAEARD